MTMRNTALLETCAMLGYIISLPCRSGGSLSVFVLGPASRLLLLVMKYSGRNGCKIIDCLDGPEGTRRMYQQRQKSHPKREEYNPSGSEDMYSYHDTVCHSSIMTTITNISITELHSASGLGLLACTLSDSQCVSETFTLL